MAPIQIRAQFFELFYSCCDVSTCWTLMWPFSGEEKHEMAFCRNLQPSSQRLAVVALKTPMPIITKQQALSCQFFFIMGPSPILRLEISLVEFPLFCCCWFRSFGIPRFDKMAKQCKWSGGGGQLPFQPNSRFKRKYLSTEATLKLGEKENSTGWSQSSVYLCRYTFIWYVHFLKYENTLFEETTEAKRCLTLGPIFFKFPLSSARLRSFKMSQDLTKQMVVEWGIPRKSHLSSAWWSILFSQMILTLFT